MQETERVVGSIALPLEGIYYSNLRYTVSSHRNTGWLKKKPHDHAHVPSYEAQKQLHTQGAVSN